MPQLASTFQDGASFDSLQTLVNEICERQAKVRGLTGICGRLVNTCKEALHTAQNAPSNTDHQCLAVALDGVSKLLNRMSSRSYVSTRYLILGDRVTAAGRTVKEAMSSYSGVPAPSAVISVQPPVVEPNVLQRELAELKKSLDKAPRQKAYKVFYDGVGVISQQALELWVTNDLDENLEKTDIRLARFGELFYTVVNNARVLVKRVDEIQCTFKEETIKRAKSLPHWTRHSEGIMQIESIQFPDLIIYGPINAIPLDAYLRQNKPCLRDKWMLAFKMASALNYVHDCDIVHRDIRASNIFMVETTPGLFEPKLAGFEICKSDKTTSIGPREEDVWHAPEIRESYGTSKATDVYAFGVLMYEILMGEPPKWIENTHPFQEKFQHNIAQWVAESYQRSPEYIKLMQLCLNPDHTKRPTMTEIFEWLSEGF
ncbi:hypothetical protein BGZ73_000241 [Actinomortierella ambigua]|nr:hypothetical protein BGZ73_000241 [Actinomortierella ambigua]